MRLAFLGYPNEYGLYTVYRNLRAGLATHGIELRWVGTGEHAEAAVKMPQWANDLAFGELLEIGSRSDARRAGEIVISHLEKKYEGVIVSPPYEKIEMNVLRYLRPEVLRILTVQSMAFGIYRLAKPLKDYVHATVGASPRVADGLIKYSGFSRERTIAIANGISPTPFANVRRRRDGGPVRLLYLGRMVDAQKGIFWLPEILGQVTSNDVTLTVVGDGEDLAELRRRCEHFGSRVTFLGRVNLIEVPQLLSEHHALLLTSRSEGLPSALIEAMAAGCVPIASMISGLTDFVVKDGETGRLFPIGDVTRASAIVNELVYDRSELVRLSERAVAEFHARFTDQMMGDNYARIIRQAATTTLPRPPELISKWAIPREFEGGLINRFIPRNLKNLIQKWLG